uniref:Uncharacterized protein n=1 Tax=Anguilla anguilla TaxID=7936 RepID=A0A0E9VVM7_ANGAN
MKKYINEIHGLGTLE